MILHFLLNCLILTAISIELVPICQQNFPHQVSYLASFRTHSLSLFFLFSFSLQITHTFGDNIQPVKACSQRIISHFFRQLRNLKERNRRKVSDPPPPLPPLTRTVLLLFL